MRQSYKITIIFILLLIPVFSQFLIPQQFVKPPIGMPGNFFSENGLEKEVEVFPVKQVEYPNFISIFTIGSL